MITSKNLATVEGQSNSKSKQQRQNPSSLHTYSQTARHSAAEIGVSRVVPRG